MILQQGTQGNGSNDDKEDVSPYFVRRWAPKVKAEMNPVRCLVVSVVFM